MRRLCRDMKDFHLHFCISIWYHGSMKLQNRTLLKQDFRLRLHSFSNRDFFRKDLARENVGGNEISLSHHRLNHYIPRVQSAPSYPLNQGL